MSPVNPISVYSVKVGDNVITRNYKDANICNWFTHESEYFNRAKKNPRPGNLDLFGWPSNLLLPKGNSRGYPCQLFAIVTADFVSGLVLGNFEV